MLAIIPARKNKTERHILDARVCGRRIGFWLWYMNPRWAWRRWQLRLFGAVARATLCQSLMLGFAPRSRWLWHWYSDAVASGWVRPL